MTLVVEQAEDVELAAALADGIEVPSERLAEMRSLSVPRLDDYFGAWCIEPIRGLAMLEHVGRMDVTAHVQTYDRKEKQYVRLYQQADGSEDIKTLAADSQIDSEQGTGIAVIEIAGTLMKSSSSLGSSSSTVSLRQEIRAAANDPAIGGIILKMDTPGGTVSGTSDLADSILFAVSKKPTWTFGEDLVASAGLWLGTQAEKFYANAKTAMIGSIGTVIGLYDKSGAAGMAGIRAKVYATGPLKGAGFPGKEISPEQDAYFQNVVNETQVHFRAAVASGRKIKLSQVAALETGGLFSASEAINNGLIDGIQSFDKTLSMMFREIKARSKAEAQVKGNGKMSTTTTKSVEQKTEDTPVVDRTAILGEMNAFVARFGAENGTKWFGEGISMTDALGRHCEALEAKLATQAKEHKTVITAKDAEIADLKTRLSQVQIGDKTGVSFNDAEKPKSEKVNLKTTSPGLARFASGIKMPVSSKN